MRSVLFKNPFILVSRIINSELTSKKVACLISIIIPAHNEYKNLALLLPRLAAIEKGFAVECIVVLSSANSDYSLELQNQPSVRFIRAAQKGRAPQMNAGAAEAKGSILAFLHADVWPPKTFLQRITDTIANGYDAGFFSYRFDKEHILLRMNAAFTKRDGFFTGGGDQCLFIRRSSFDSLGGFDEAQLLMEDFAFFRAMKSAKVPYTIVPEDLIVSARKYESNSYLRINLTNLLLVLLFRLNVAPKRLRSLHYKLLKVPR